MPSLTTCLKQAGAYLSDDHKRAILAEANKLRAAGKTADEAAREAIKARAAHVSEALASSEKMMADGLMAKPTPAEVAEGESMPSRIERAMVERPGMLVMLDGMEAPMRLDDFMASVKAEADAMNADAPLLQAAAECAISFGASL